jgi:phosphoesterase RecJ-like protein
MEVISAIKRTLLGHPKKIVITMHTNPDADALGSSLALAHFLKKKGHQVSVIAPTDYPDFLDWIQGSAEVIVYAKSTSNKKLSTNLIAQADIIFCIDFAILNRIDGLEEAVNQAKATKIVIDHHLDTQDFGDIMLWKPQAAASAELIYELIEGLGETNYIDKDIAEALYVGIITDTLSFKTPNTTPHVHRIVAKLLEFQVDIPKINKLVYENNSINKLKFLSFVLSKRLTVIPDCKTAYITIKAADAKQFNLNTGDTEGLVNYALSIKDITLAALIKEKQDGIYISLRSIGDFPVNTLAREYFKGGGHKNAAGGVSDLPLEETVAKFEELVKSKHKAC